MSFDGPHGLQWIPLVGVYTIGTIVTWLSGKKTYLGAIAYACYGLFQIIAEKNVTGGVGSLITAWTVFAGRAAIAKLAPKPA